GPLFGRIRDLGIEFPEIIYNSAIVDTGTEIGFLTNHKCHSLSSLVTIESLFCPAVVRRIVFPEIFQIAAVISGNKIAFVSDGESGCTLAGSSHKVCHTYPGTRIGWISARSILIKIL